MLNYDPTPPRRLRGGGGAAGGGPLAALRRARRPAAGARPRRELRPPDGGDRRRRCGARRPDMIYAEVPTAATSPSSTSPRRSPPSTRCWRRSPRAARVTDIAAIRAAAARARGIRRTPLLSSPELDREAGRRVLVKAECLQVTGSFKARGAWAAVSALAPEERATRRPRLFLGEPRAGRRLGRGGARDPGGDRDARRRAGGEDRGDARLGRRGRALRPRDRGPRRDRAPPRSRARADR